jgi:hypothetical protein
MMPANLPSFNFDYSAVPDTSFTVCTVRESPPSACRPPACPAPPLTASFLELQGREWLAECRASEKSESSEPSSPSQ